MKKLIIVIALILVAIISAVKYAGKASKMTREQLEQKYSNILSTEEVRTTLGLKGNLKKEISFLPSPNRLVLAWHVGTPRYSPEVEVRIGSYSKDEYLMILNEDKASGAFVNMLPQLGKQAHACYDKGGEKLTVYFRKKQGFSCWLSVWIRVSSSVLTDWKSNQQAAWNRVTKLAEMLNTRL